MNIENTVICVDWDDLQNVVETAYQGEDDLSKDFYDWYLKKNEYLLKKGYIKFWNDGIIHCIVRFDLTEPDEAEFEIVTEYGKKICLFYFEREKNLTLDPGSIEIDIDFYNPAAATDEMFLSKFEITEIDDKHVKAVCYGEEISPEKSGTVVKAVTYHNFKFEKTKEGYKATISFDI